MENKTNFNSKVKIYEACSKDNTRPFLSCVNFVDGYAIATNAHIIVMNRIDEICNLDMDQTDLLNGKSLPANSYKKMLEYDTIEISEEGIECFSLKKGKVFFYFQSEEKAEDGTAKPMPDFLGVVRKMEDNPVCSKEKLTLNLSYYDVIDKSLYAEDNGVIFSFRESGVIIRPINDFCNGVAVMMMITTDL